MHNSSLRTQSVSGEHGGRMANPSANGSYGIEKHGRLDAVHEVKLLPPSINSGISLPTSPLQVPDKSPTSPLQTGPDPIAPSAVGVVERLHAQQLAANSTNGRDSEC